MPAEERKLPIGLRYEDRAKPSAVTVCFLMMKEPFHYNGCVHDVSGVMRCNHESPFRLLSRNFRMVAWGSHFPNFFAKASILREASCIFFRFSSSSRSCRLPSIYFSNAVWMRALRLVPSSLASSLISSSSSSFRNTFTRPITHLLGANTLKIVCVVKAN